MPSLSTLSTGDSVVRGLPPPDKRKIMSFSYLVSLSALAVNNKYGIENKN